MRLALDEGVSHPLAGHLRCRGYDADTATELGRRGLSDVQVLVHAALSGQTVDTHNKHDFVMLHEAWLGWRRWETEVVQATGVDVAISDHAGILIVPQYGNHDLGRIIEPFADAHDAIDDRLFAWTAARGWYEVSF